MAYYSRLISCGGHAEVPGCQLRCRPCLCPLCPRWGWHCRARVPCWCGARGCPAGPGPIQGCSGGHRTPQGTARCWHHRRSAGRLPRAAGSSPAELQCLPTPRWVSIFCHSPRLTHFGDVSIPVAMVTRGRFPAALRLLLSRVLAQEPPRPRRVPGSPAGQGRLLSCSCPTCPPRAPALALGKFHRT